MVKVDKLFFELLQIALGNLERLSRVPSAEEWTEIYAESERQAVTGLLLHGIDRLPADQRPPQALILQWIGVGQMIEQRNHLLNGRCKKLLSSLTAAELHPTILKGQGIAQCYPEALQKLRQPGDIDVYVSDGREKAIAYAKSLGQKNIEWDYKHLHLKIWDDTEVEMHYHVEVLLDLWKNRRLQKWFKTHTEHLFGHTDFTDLITPTVEFNVFYILLHIYRHFLYEGVGLRQIVDYYFVLKGLNLNANDNLNSNTNHTNRANFAIEAVNEFGMKRFAKGLMWAMHEALGVPCEWMLWEPDEKEGRYILEEVMAGGNFGHHDERLTHGSGKWNTVKQVCKHNWHLMSHYPADVIWAPVWFVWHKCWKLKTKALLAIKS